MENPGFWIQKNCFESHCMRAKSLQLCPTLCDPMDCSLPGSSVHGILQARVLEWVAISFFIESHQIVTKVSSLSHLLSNGKDNTCASLSWSEGQIDSKYESALQLKKKQIMQSDTYNCFEKFRSWKLFIKSDLRYIWEFIGLPLKYSHLSCKMRQIITILGYCMPSQLKT